MSLPESQTSLNKWMQFLPVEPLSIFDTELFPAEKQQKLHKSQDLSINTLAKIVLQLGNRSGSTRG